MKTTTHKQETASDKHAVQPAQEINIACEGGMIEGKLIGIRSRMAKDGETVYRGWVIDASKAVAEDSHTKLPQVLPAGRYFVFSALRLDLLSQEVEKAEFVRISYLGKVANDKTVNTHDGDGFHHEYQVVYR
jgi:hypothetical protein